MKLVLLKTTVIVVDKLTRSRVLQGEVRWGGALWGPKGRGWGKKIFPIMWGGTGMGEDKTMWGRSEDPIFRPRLAPPRPIAIPSWTPYN